MMITSWLLIFVLCIQELLYQKITVLEWQFLTIFALHNRPVFIEGVRWKVVQVTEWVEHELGFPLDREVVIILDCVVISTEKVRLEFRIGLTSHAREALITSTLIHWEDKVDMAGLVSLRDSVEELTCWSESGWPDAMLDWCLHWLEVHALHYKVAGITIIDWGLINFLLPFFEFGLVNLIAIGSPISFLVPTTVLMVVFASTFSSLVVVMAISAVSIVLIWSVPGRVLAAATSTSSSVGCCCSIANIGVRVIC